MAREEDPLNATRRGGVVRPTVGLTDRERMALHGPDDATHTTVDTRGSDSTLSDVSTDQPQLTATPIPETIEIPADALPNRANIVSPPVDVQEQGGPDAGGGPSQSSERSV